MRLPLLFLLGGGWAMLHAMAQMADRLDPLFEGRDLTIAGTVLSIPDLRGERTRFDFSVEAVAEGVQGIAPQHLRLSWYDAALIPQVGEQWRLTVRLRRPHGLYNPGGFDYEGWLFRQGVQATGYVRAGEANRRLAEAGGRLPLQQLRNHVGLAIDRALDGDGALLRALVIGDRSGLRDGDWELFMRTGTNHLVAISGLHIGIIAGFGLFLGRGIWRSVPRLCLRLPAQRAGAGIALATAMVYAALSGFAVPAQRALIMLGVVLGGLLLGRQVQPMRAMALALLMVVLFDPFAVLSPGFWLSFAAVGVILASYSGRIGGGMDKGASLIRVQFVVSLGLLPVLFAWNLGISPLAPLVNLVMVPFYSLLIVPLALSGTLLFLIVPGFGQLLLGITAWLLELSRTLLVMAAGLPIDLLYPVQLTPWAILIAGSGIALMLLAPAGVPRRWLGAVPLLLLLQAPPERPPPGAVWLSQLDVGQGLATVVRTRNHVLIYDAGPRYGEGFDAGEGVVIPYLRWIDVRHIDVAIISNGDMDHRGGLDSLRRQFPIRRVLSGEPERIASVSAEPCMAGMGWRWDGVDFHLLHPDGTAGWRGNNGSCVLLIDNGAARLLLTGDIEAAVEEHLLHTSSAMLDVDLVVAPHHGSGTSSTEAFVDAVSARDVVVSAGYRNRYGFPRPAVIQRWRDSGARLFSTADLGMLEVRFARNGDRDGPTGFRERAHRYWMDRPVTAAQ